MLLHNKNGEQASYAFYAKTLTMTVPCECGSMNSVEIELKMYDMEMKNFFSEELLFSYRGAFMKNSCYKKKIKWLEHPEIENTLSQKHFLNK